MIQGITFDIDTTLTFEVSWFRISQKLGADPNIHSTIFKDFTDNKINYQNAKSLLIDLWQRTGNANKLFFTEIFHEIPLKTDAKKIIDHFKSKGIPICLITGSVDLYAKIIADRLGVEQYYSNTQLIWNKNDQLIDFNYKKKQGEKKLEQFNDFCIKFNLPKDKILVVGDDENDIELFRYTQHGIAVASATSNKLESYAWKTIKYLSELKEFTNSL